MSSYKAPLDDLRFALFDVLDSEANFARLGYADANRELVDAVLDEAARFTETVLAPAQPGRRRVGVQVRPGHRRGDRAAGLQAGFDQSWRWLDRATTAPGARRRACQRRWAAADRNGRQRNWLGQLPDAVNGAVQALADYGEDWQRRVFLNRWVAGT